MGNIIRFGDADTFQMKAVGSSMTDHSGTTTANTSVLVMAANPNRSFFFFQNLSNSVVFINFGAAATNGSPSIQIAPADTWSSDRMFVPTDAVYVWAASDALAFTAKEG